LATAWPPRDRETGAEAAGACRPPASARRRSRRTRLMFSAWIAARSDFGRDHLQAESGLYRRSQKSETGRRSSARSGVRGERTTACESRGPGLGHGLDEAAIAAANKMRFKPASAKRAGRWIRQQLCTWYFNWRIETLEIESYAEVEHVMSSMNWMVLALLAVNHDGSGPAAGVRAAEPTAGCGNRSPSEPGYSSAQANLAPPTTMDQVVDRVICARRT
jgi:hypothetical protein